jgi:hypothetical protein
MKRLTFMYAAPGARAYENLPWNCYVSGACVLGSTTLEVCCKPNKRNSRMLQELLLTRLSIMFLSHAA